MMIQFTDKGKRIAKQCVVLKEIMGVQGGRDLLD